MKRHRLSTFFRNLATTVKQSPAETLLICAFLVYGALVVWRVLGGDPEATGAWEARHKATNRLWLWPFAFTIAYVLGRLAPRGPWRTIYLFSPLLIVPFFWVDMTDWLDKPAFWTALGLCPVAVILHRWRKNNAMFVADAVHYIKNGLFALALSSIAYGLVVAIYYSLQYIFPILPLGNSTRIMEYLPVVFYGGVMPLVFLTFDREQREGFAPVRIADILVNYVLTPALVIYAAILYVYFVKIVATWSLPKGGIAYLVFGFTLVAVVVKAFQPLMGKRVLGWFYDRFSLISLPALAMFWVGVGRRVSEYGLTEGRIYLLICGAVMTVTVLMFLVPRVAAYRYTVLGGALLFALVAFVPGLTAEDIALRSQQHRFEAAATRLGMLDADGGLILEKRPDATPEQHANYTMLYEAFRYIDNETPDETMKSRYGVEDHYEFSRKLMPDNMPHGELRGKDGGTQSIENIEEYVDRDLYISGYYTTFDADIRGYSSMHKLRGYNAREEKASPSYHYRADSLSLTIYSPSGDILEHRTLNEILERQLARAGLSELHGTYTQDQLQRDFGKMMLWEDGHYGVIFSAMRFHNGDTLRLTELEPKLLLIKE